MRLALEIAFGVMAGTAGGLPRASSGIAYASGYFLGRLRAGGFSLALDSTKPMNSATDTPKAGASLKMVLTLALFLPSSSNDM